MDESEPMQEELRRCQFQIKEVGLQMEQLMLENERLRLENEITETEAKLQLRYEPQASSTPRGPVCSQRNHTKNSPVDNNQIPDKFVTQRKPKGEEQSTDMMGRRRGPTTRHIFRHVLR